MAIEEIEEIKNMKFNDDELKGNFGKYYNFNRLIYLKDKEQFEEKKAKYDYELNEFNEDTEDLAAGLAYTRYMLVRAECLIKKMLTTIKIEKNKIIKNDLEITYSKDELQGDFSKLCDFYDRIEYLLYSIKDEELDYYEYYEELEEFNEDTEALACELAYTRYSLAKAELLIKEMLTKQAEKGDSRC